MEGEKEGFLFFTISVDGGLSLRVMGSTENRREKGTFRGQP